jgi:hypothetical protein
VAAPVLAPYWLKPITNAERKPGVCACTGQAKKSVKANNTKAGFFM